MVVVVERWVGKGPDDHGGEVVVAEAVMREMEVVATVMGVVAAVAVKAEVAMTTVAEATARARAVAAWERAAATVVAGPAAEEAEERT